MKKFLTWFLWIAMLFGGVYFVAKWADWSMNQSEIVECRKWQEQAAQFAGGFYLVKWQSEQCQAHNITINAPVK